MRKKGYQDEIWWPDFLDMVSGQFLAGDCLRELSSLGATGARGSNPRVPARGFKECRDILTINLSQRTRYVIQ
jgi:hypothetical protein